MAIAAIVFGAIGIVTFWIPIWQWIVLILSIVGIVLAVLGKKNLEQKGESTGVAIAGLVLSIIATVFSGFGAIVCTVCIGAAACL